ncbi:MAG TPA: PepSY domain-containing protein [Stellaceae bacterium]|nr:PepSY domain-containing protein [Stellaceae bacterium]
MNRLLLVAAAVALSAGPALAAGPSKCTTAPKSKWQPEAKLEAQLKSEGLKVRQIKVENGCYEVYATDKAGKRTNMAFNAETLQKLDNPEAGED